MKKEILQAKLEQLRTELAGASGLDEKTYVQLRALVADIERAIETESEDAESEPLSEQVEDMVLKFEAEHPQLTSALNQVAAALANIGI
jgi:outer membrane protein TolC